MFDKVKTCNICGEKLHKSTAIQLSDGLICPACGRICSKSMLASADTVKQAWKENHKRFQNFNQSMVVTNLGSGYIFVDTENRQFYMSSTKNPKMEPLVFTFSEIEEYSLEMVGQKTITKKKGGLGRAVVGGALFGGAGAIVGAFTAKEETKTVGGISVLHISLSAHGLRTNVDLFNPPVNSAQFLDNATEE